MDKHILFSVIIKIKKENLKKINQLFSYHVKVIKQDHDFFYLQIQEKDLNLLQTTEIKYHIISYQGLKHFYQLLLSHFSVLIGIILFLLILYVNTLTIKEISFSTYTKDNEKIQSIIESQLISVADVHFLKGDINELNFMLRKEFSHFEWISVQRKGCNLEVKILEPSIINNQIEKIEGFGDLVAKNDGMIKFFKVQQGLPLIERNQYVKKGQVLVSGNLRYQSEDESEFYIPANGEVFAEVWYTKTIVVPKEITSIEYTGKVSLEKNLSLFGIDIKYKSAKHDYADYEKEINMNFLEIFKLKLPIGIKKIHYLEKSDIINVYNKQTAYDYAVSRIRYQMAQSFRENDQILEIACVKKSEDESSFTYEFFVRTYEDIAIFQRRAVNE